MSTDVSPTTALKRYLIDNGPDALPPEILSHRFGVSVAGVRAMVGSMHPKRGYGVARARSDTKTAALKRHLTENGLGGTTLIDLAARFGLSAKTVGSVTASLGLATGPPARSRVLDDAAVAALVARHDPLAKFHAAPFLRKNPRESDDIMAAARLGLKIAALSFDPARGRTFATHSHWQIRGKILLYLKVEAPIIAIPCHLQGKGRESADSALLAAADRARKIRTGDLYPDGGDPVQDIACPSPPADDGPDLGPLLATLTGKARRVLELRYGLGGGEPLLFHEIARLVGCHPETARQIGADALTALRREVASCPT